MNGKDWQDLMGVLDKTEIRIRQAMEEITAAGGVPPKTLMADYRRVCELQVKVELHLQEATPV